jgi:rubrerythrin
MAELSTEVIKAIEMAIQMEKDGLKYYEDAAQKSKNELARKTFLRIAQDEVGHLKTFQKMFDTLTGTEGWRELANFSPKVGKVPVFEGKVEKKGDVDPSEIDALRIALENERKGIELYKKAADASNDDMAKEIFVKISKEEEYHYDLLQAQMDYLTKSGFYFDIGEFEMDGTF